MLTRVGSPAAELSGVVAGAPNERGGEALLRFFVEPSDYDADRRAQVMRSIAAIRWWEREHVGQGAEPEVDGVENTPAVVSDVSLTLDALLTRSLLVASLGRTVGVGSLVQYEGDQAAELSYIGTAPAEVSDAGRLVLGAALLAYDEHRGQQWMDEPTEAGSQARVLPEVVVDFDSLSVSGSRLALV